MKFKFDIQFFGSSGDTKRYPKRDPNYPEPEGLTDIRNGLIDKIMPGLEAFDPTGWDKARGIADRAQEAQLGLIDQLPGALERGNSILDEMLGVVRTGEVPTAFTDRMNQSVTKDLQSGMGSMLNSLGSRGVLNSSITSQGTSRLAQQAADAYNRNYLNAFNSVVNGYAQGLQGAQGNAQTLLGGVGALGSIPSQAYEGVSAALMPAFNLWKTWQSLYDNREDYDTVVTQGGGGCVTGDTRATLETGEDAPVAELRNDARIMAWDLEAGRVAAAPLTAFFKNFSNEGFDVIRVEFEDGSSVGVIKEHLFFDLTLEKFVAVNAESQDFIGHEFARAGEDGKARGVKVAAIRKDGKAKEAYAPQAEGSLSYLVNGFISGNDGQLGLCNRFEFDVEGMRWDPDKKAADLRKYGELEYEALGLGDLVSREFFEKNRCGEFSAAIGKGLMSLYDLRAYLARYSHCFFK